MRMTELLPHLKAMAAGKPMPDSNATLNQLALAQNADRRRPEIFVTAMTKPLRTSLAANKSPLNSNR